MIVYTRNILKINHLWVSVEPEKQKKQFFLTYIYNFLFLNISTEIISKK